MSDPNIKRVRLFHFNDFHRRLDPLSDGTGGAARLVGKIKQLEQDNPDAITVNLGDVCGDNTAQGPNHFSPIPELFNQADVDILALGNHEFEDPTNDYQSLKEGLIKPFRGEVLVANVKHADGRSIEGTKPYTIRQLRDTEEIGSLDRLEIGMLQSQHYLCVVEPPGRGPYGSRLWQLLLGGGKARE